MSNVSSVFDQIREANYLVTETEVQELAARYMDAAETQGRADGSYLKILLATCQQTLPKRKKLTDPKITQKEHLDKAHDKYYWAVLKGVMTDDIALVDGLEESEVRRRKDEQARRATFARTSKSTLSSYIDAGGDVRTLDVGTVSKGQLRKFVGENSGTPIWKTSVESHRSKIEKVCRNLSHTNPDMAREILESVLQHLQNVLDSITGGTADSTKGVVVFAAETPVALMEVPEDFGEQTQGVEHLEHHIPEIGEFSEVAA